MRILFSFVRSESPCQAFLILILWLYRKFKPLLDEGMSSQAVAEVMTKTILAYDNMCHVDGLKAAAKSLHFPAPLDKVWSSIVKVIDKLHIRNHKDARCKTLYNPEGKVPEGFNTMAAEQTFVWGSRLKRIVCAMPRLHQFFLLASCSETSQPVHSALPQVKQSPSPSKTVYCLKYYTLLSLLIKCK